MPVLRGMTWDHPRGFDPMVATAEEFARNRPGVRIEWDKRPLQAFADRPIEVMAPEYDLIVIDHPHVGEAAAQGVIRDFRELAPLTVLDKLAAEAVGLSHLSYEYDGGQWALSIDAASPVSCFRSDRLEAAPTRWDEVIRLAESGRVIWPVKPVDALMSFFNIANNLGFPLATDDRFMDRKEGMHVLEIMRSVIRHLPTACLDMNPINAYDQMSTTDEFDYCPYGFGYVNYSRAGFRPRLLRFADAPAIGSDGPRGSCLGGTGLAISSGSQYAELAAEYALWVAGAECQKGLYFMAGGQPGNNAAWDDDRCNELSDNFFRNTRKTLEKSWLRPRYNGYLLFQDQGGTILNQHFRNGSSADQAMNDLEVVYQASLVACRG